MHHATQTSESQLVRWPHLWRQVTTSCAPLLPLFARGRSRLRGGMGAVCCGCCGESAAERAAREAEEAREAAEARSRAADAALQRQAKFDASAAGRNAKASAAAAKGPGYGSTAQARKDDALVAGWNS